MPQQICNKCASEVRRAFAYKEMCANSDEVLRNYFQSRKTLKPLESTEQSKQKQSFQSNQILKSELEPNLSSDCDDSDDHFSIPNYLNDLDEELNKQDSIFLTKNIINYPSVSDGETKNELHSNQHNKIVEESLEPSRHMLASQLLDQPNGPKVGICRICERKFNGLASLRSHLWSHAMDGDSFGEVPLTKLVLLCEKNIATAGEAIGLIQTMLRVKYILRN